MEEVIRFLKENQYGYLATVDNGKPRVRPFGFMFEEEGRLYFCTNSNKAVYRQLKENTNVEYSVMNNRMVTLRINGEAAFCDETDKKEKALNANNLVKQMYKSAENPIFKVFYIEHGNATLSDFSGQPPRKVVF